MALSVTLVISASGASAFGASTAPPGVRAPLTTGITTSTTAWAIVTMGKNDQQNDLFPQLFAFDQGAKRWRLSTPPGVADNGGLVIASNSQSSLLVGFGANQALSFSPLALSTDGGKQWSPGGVAQALVPVPSSLALGASNAALALVSNRAGQSVLRRNGDLTSWSEILSSKTLASGAPSCAPQSLSAVGITTAGRAIVGASCAGRGTIGLFEENGRRWQAVPAAVPANLAGSAFEVIAIERSGSAIEALLAARSASATALVAAWPTTGASWQLSAPLALAKGSTITATGDGPADTLFVIVRSRDALRAETIAGVRGAWRRVASLPPSTTSVAIEPTGLMDALVVDISTLTIWHQTRANGPFEKVQRITVPIQYGSSA